jgi:hypothetical protein
MKSIHRLSNFYMFADGQRDMTKNIVTQFQVVVPKAPKTQGLNFIMVFRQKKKAHLAQQNSQATNVYKCVFV